MVIQTPRIILRPWRNEDIQPFAALNADPRVMEFFPATLTHAETETLVEVFREKFEKNGFCFWAAELRATKAFIGFVGLSIPGFETSFTPCVEIGWRLAHEHWGHGYAQEG